MLLLSILMIQGFQNLLIYWDDFMPVQNLRLQRFHKEKWETRAGIKHFGSDSILLILSLTIKNII